VSPVEIQAIQGSLILRARGSELLILPHHVSALKGLKQPTDFTSYFLQDALLNRPARKLFEAWLRKDGDLWKRIYRTIQKEMTDVEESAPEKQAAPAKKPKVEAKEVQPKMKKTETAVEAKDMSSAKKTVVSKPKAEEKAAAPAKKAAAAAPAAKKVTKTVKEKEAPKKKTAAAAKTAKAKPATKAAAKPAAAAKKKTKTATKAKSRSK
jgi:hypothetical protein